MIFVELGGRRSKGHPKTFEALNFLFSRGMVCRWVYGEANSETIGVNGVMEKPHDGTIIANVINFGTTFELFQRVSIAFR